jgi:hypothetical protein
MANLHALHCNASRWIAYADQWQLPGLLTAVLSFISTHRRGDNDLTKGVTDGTMAPSYEFYNSTFHCYPSKILSFKALLRAGRLEDDLAKLSAPIVMKVMQAALMGKGCSSCSGPGNYECLCPNPGASGSALSSCSTCKTRYICSKCGGYLDA